MSKQKLLCLGVMLMSGYLLPAESMAEDTDSVLLHLKVDCAARSGPDTMDPIPETVKDGWWTWTLRDWEFYRTDLNWHDGGASYPDDSGIDGSGVHAAITCHYEGVTAIHVAGMRRYLAGGIQPEKKPIHDPIANTWVAGTDFPGRPSDILLGLYHLPAGEYRLLSYHNSFNARRFGDNPTAIEHRFTDNPQHPMPAILGTGLHISCSTLSAVLVRTRDEHRLATVGDDGEDFAGTPRRTPQRLPSPDLIRADGRNQQQGEDASTAVLWHS